MHFEVGPGSGLLMLWASEGGGGARVCVLRGGASGVGRVAAASAAGSWEGHSI